METITATKKITLATVKSFINKNRENLFINVKSDFDGMTDCCEVRTDGFQPAKADKTQAINASDYRNTTMGIEGVWFTSSRNYFYAFENETLKGYEVSNCCGRFIVAIAK